MMKHVGHPFKHGLRLALSLAVLLATVAPLPADRDDCDIAAAVTGEAAYDHVAFLSEVIGARVTGTAEERRAAAYIREQLDDMDYKVRVQPFSFTTSAGETIASANIVAVKPGRRNRTVIVGAHYDSVSYRACDDGNFLTGAGDNASGVGVMLEVAEILEEYPSRGRIIFVAFGGEEKGLWGARHFADQMSDKDVEHTVAMINLDSVGAGDFFYVYAGLDDNPGWVRDQALDIGARLGYDLRTSPESEWFVRGTTGDWSDHVPFRLLGIPIAYFEWMNWDIEPDGGIETAAYGWIMHTCRDNLYFTSQDKLEKTADVVATLVHELGNQRISKPDRQRERARLGTAAAAVKAFQVQVQKRKGRPD